MLNQDSKSTNMTHKERIEREAESRTNYKIRQQWFKYGANFALDLDRWVKCSDRMPELDERVIVKGSYGIVTATFFDDGFRCLGMTIEDVTHWQPLPKLPK